MNSSPLNVHTSHVCATDTSLMKLNVLVHLLDSYEPADSNATTKLIEDYTSEYVDYVWKELTDSLPPTSSWPVVVETEKGEKTLSYDGKIVPLLREHGSLIIHSVILDLFIIYCVFEWKYNELLNRYHSEYFDAAFLEKGVNVDINLKPLLTSGITPDILSLVFPEKYNELHAHIASSSLSSFVPFEPVHIVKMKSYNTEMIMKYEREFGEDESVVNTINSHAFRDTIHGFIKSYNTLINDASRHLNIAQIHEQNKTRIDEMSKSLASSLTITEDLVANSKKMALHPDDREKDLFLAMF
jgi:hypothetical protein